MILHTIIPMEIVMQNTVMQKRKVVTITNGGLMFEVEDKDGQLIKRRLISTDPYAFLDSKNAPGTPLNGKKI